MSSQTHVKGRKILSIDFGSHSLKFVSGKQTKEGLVIYKVITIPIPADLYNNGEVVNPKELGALVSATINDNGFKKLPVVCTVSGQNCIMRILSLPAVKQGELSEMVQYEVQQYLPVDAAQYVLQYTVLNKPAEATLGTTSVLVGAIPRAFAEVLYNMFLEIDIIPHALDLQTHSVSKWVERFLNAPENTALKGQTILFVDLGHNQMDISVYEDDYFYMNRRVSSCGAALDQKITRVFDLSLSDAQLEKHQTANIRGHNQEYSSEHRVQNVVQTTVDEWIIEISRVVKFYVSRSGKSVSSIFLFGGSSQIKGLADYVGTELSIETNVIDKCSMLSFEEMAVENPATLINALGAMIRKEDKK